MNPIIFLYIFLFIIAYLVIYFAADALIDNLADSAAIFRMSPFLIGIFILGIDPEETVASVIAAINGLPGIAIGNVIGNTIIALSLCFGFPALVYGTSSKLKLQNTTSSNFYFFFILWCELLIALPFIFQLYVPVLAPYNLLVVGIISILSFCAYIGKNVYQYNVSAKTDIVIEPSDSESSDSDSSSSSSSSDAAPTNVQAQTQPLLNDTEIAIETTEEEHEARPRRIKPRKTYGPWYTNKKLWKKLGYVLFWLIALSGSGELLIWSSGQMLKETHVLDQNFFGYVIVGFATNVEEITMVIMAIHKGQVAIGVGGLIGKLIWNVALTFGLTAVILVRGVFTSIDLINMGYLFAVTLYWCVVMKYELISTFHGVLLCTLFVGYVALNSVLVAE